MAPIPIWDIRGTVCPFMGPPGGKAKSFIVPEVMKMNADAMRRMLKR
jgi:hypothetical protein